MRWQEACGVSINGTAVRLDETEIKGHQVIRKMFRTSDGDGDIFIYGPRDAGPVGRPAIPGELEGFTDWEPVE